MHTGNIKQAIETYQMAIMLNPGLVDAHSNLGNLFKAQVGKHSLQLFGNLASVFLLLCMFEWPCGCG